MNEERYSSIQNDSTGNILCLVCGGQTVHHQPAPNWGEMRRCLSCGLVSANPISLPGSSVSLFGSAYQGKVSASNMHQFATRLKLRDDLKSLGMTVQGWGTDLAIDWLKSNIPAGSVILDIGCGTGLFLAELSRAGFQPLGLDVAQEVVEVLRRDGYRVWLGNVRDIPTDWPEPAACTCFYVLHHVVDPIGLLRDIYHRFPHTPLLLTEINNPALIRVKAASMPPRTLTWWTAQALQIASERAGYNVHTILSPPRQASELGIPPLTKFYLAMRHILPLRLLVPYYLKVKRLLFAPWVAIYRMMGRRSCYLVISVPTPQEKTEK